MNKLYLTENQFDKSLSQKDDLYRLIMSARPQIYVISQKWKKGTFAAPNRFISFGKENGISVSPYESEERNLIASLERDEYDSDAIYILNVGKEAAAKLRKKRIMCLSQNNFKNEKSLLIDDAIVFSPRNGETGYGWNKVLNPISSVPSNTLLIIDRYLFDSDVKSGAKNLKSILDVILPVGTCIELPYRIYLVIAHKKEMSYSECNSKCDKIIKLINLPKRTYKIDLFLYSISPKCKTFNPITHNRRIAFESGRVEATYKLDAFKFQSSLCNQSLFVEHLFSKANLNGSGDSAYKANYDDWEAFESFMEECKKENWLVKEDDNPDKPIVIYKHINIIPQNSAS